MSWYFLLALFAGVFGEVQITEPASLVRSLGKEGQVKFTISTFGELLYTETAIINVIAPKDSNSMGCEPLSAPKIPKGEKFVWLFERGTCTYSKKAFNSQQSGAFAVLVYHNDPSVDISNIIPISDAIFSNIKIPIILISHDEGVKITRAIQEGEAVKAKLHLEISSGTAAHLNAEYWMNPASLESYDFIIRFREHLRKLGSAVSLKVLYKFRDLSGEKNKIDHNCFSKGKFCATETMGFEPNSVLKEGLRQICIWNLSERQNNEHRFWFDYIHEYRDCVKDKMKLYISGSQPCFEFIKERLSIEKSVIAEIESCVERSYEDKSDPIEKRNFLLESNQNSYEYSLVYLVPALFINKSLVKEHLSPMLVLSALCEKLEPKPATCLNAFTNVIDWEFGQKLNYQKSVTAIITLAMVGVISLVLIYCCLKRFSAQMISSEASTDIRSHVTEYMRVKDLS